MKKKPINPLNVGNIEVLDASELLMNIDSLTGPEDGSAASKKDDTLLRSGFSRKRLEEQGLWEEQIEEIEKGLRQQLAVDRYARDCYNWMQMREIRLGLLEGINTKWYENPFFSAGQMREIRLGLTAGLKVASYAKLSYTSRDMEKARRELMQARYSVNPRGFARVYEDEESGLRIRISDDCMEAFVTFTKDEELTPGEIEKILAKNDVVFGALEEKLEEAAALKCCGKEIRVARGEKEEAGDDGRYEFFFNPLLPGPPREMEDGSVDYTEIVEAEKVSAGDVLAQYYPAAPARDGRTVTGIRIPGRHGRELLPLTGKGFSVDREKGIYTATMDGFVLLDEEKGTINIWNVFIVPGNVNRYNGHITYDGIIHILGNVGDMAEIEASGNIVVEGTVESARLTAGENVILKGGINGGDGGSIRAGRKVLGKFFESADIQAGSDVEGNYFMNCLIETDGRLIARGKKGRIIGGRMQILGGVEAVSIGNYNSMKTVLDVGNPAQTEERRKAILAKLNKVEHELHHLKKGRKKLSKMLGDNLAQNNHLFQKTCRAIDVLENQKQELENGNRYLDSLLKRALKATIIVRGSLQEGVRVIINGSRKEIRKTLTGKVVIKKETKGE